MRRSKTDLFDIFNYILMAAIVLVVVVPFIHTIAVSFSSTPAIFSGEVTLWPKDIDLEVYGLVVNDPLFLRGYLNSFVYTAVATVCKVLVTFMAAYPLAKKDLPLRKPIMVAFVITMFFTGGMIPTFLVVRGLGLYNTLWALVLVDLVLAYYLILARNFIEQTIPAEIHEAARIDGATDIQIFARIILPLSKSIIAVLALYYAVLQWNDYTKGILYLRDEMKYPLTLVLRKILLSTDPGILPSLSHQAAYTYNLKYAAILVSIVPMLIAYPFVQKHFVKGIMLGSVKS